MYSATALLISRDESVIDVATRIARSIENLELRVCNSIGRAYSLLHESHVALVLLHLTSGSEHSEGSHFLRVVAKTWPLCPTLVLSDEYRNEQALAMLRAGATDYFALPQELSKLPYLFDIFTLGARKGALPSAS